MRDAANTSGKYLGVAYAGERYEILDEAQDNRTPPVTWYQIKWKDGTGWISSLHVTVTEEEQNKEEPEGPKDPAEPEEPGNESEEDFEAYLEEQGFPESYWEGLKELHAKYPEWIFEAQHTNLDWSEVIREEYKLGRNLVHTNSISSWKSTQTGAYNWQTGKWIGLDGASWVAASEGIIEHYMDPRNFLGTNSVFQFLKQSYDADSLTEEQLAKKKAALEKMVAGTFLAGNYTENGKKVAYVDTLMEAGKASGVCPLTLASMIIQEQGTKGTGLSISGKQSGYEGYYNYFNVGAYATSSMTAVQRGLWFAKGGGTGSTSFNRPWNTRTASILGGSSYYGKNYVEVGQDTMYLKKFNVQGKNKYDHQYMSNVQGASSEGLHVAKGYSEAARAAELVFKIPVFENMPETPAAQPAGNQNPNYMLKSIVVEGQSLTPTFSLYETSYAVTVPYGVSSVNISAAAYASATKIDGVGTKELMVGTNKFEIVSTAENGEQRIYNLKVVRQKGTVVEPVSVSSTVYKLNEDMTITGVKEFPVSANDFLKNITVANGTVKILKADGSALAGNISTGSVLKVYDKDAVCKYTYQVVIYGDANGDGMINAKDLLMIQKNNIKIKELEGVNLTAADVNRDGKVNAKDLLLVQKNNIKISTIEQ